MELYMSWAFESVELDEDTDWTFADTIPEGRWEYAFQNIAGSASSGTGVFSGTRTSDIEDSVLDWIPGNNGKGIVTQDDTVYTWNALGALQEPWHFEYAQEHGIAHQAAQFYIDPDGGVYNMLTGADEEEEARIRQVIREAEPRLNVGEGGGWTFSRTAAVHDGDVLDWDEGNYGKGIVDTHGNVYTWNEDDGWELHRDYADDHDITGRFFFTIDPDGRIDSADMQPLDPGALDLINEADNRLYGEPTVAWSF
jgi:hypothetical protein